MPKSKVVRKQAAKRTWYKPKRQYQSRSYAVARTIATINNAQPNQAIVQAILAVHNPGAATGWAQVAYEVLSGQALLQMFQNAFVGTVGAQLAGIAVSAKTESSLNIMIAYKETQNSPYRVISGVGFAKAYFKFPSGAVNRMLPDHVVIIAEAATTFRFKFYLAKSTVRSSI